MARGATRRTWVKLFITGWLHGSIRWQMEPDERSVWADLICLAGECGKAGKIIDNDLRPFPPGYLANHLNITAELLNRTIEKCKKDGRLVNDDNILEISNWKYYQSEYERQLPYRQVTTESYSQKLQPKVTADTPSDTPSPASKSTIMKERERPLKQKYGEFQNVLLTEKEYHKLCERFGGSLAEHIETLSEGIASKGYKYASHYAALLSWDRREKKKVTEVLKAKSGYAGDRFPDHYPTEKELYGGFSNPPIPDQRPAAVNSPKV